MSKWTEKLKSFRVRYVFNGHYLFALTNRFIGIWLLLLVIGLFYTGNRYFAEEKLKIYNQTLIEMRRFEVERRRTEIELGNTIRPTQLLEELSRRNIPVEFSCDTIYRIGK